MAEKIPEVCRAALVRNKGPNYTLECVEDYPVPKPKRGELLIRLNKTGLCMSDHHFMAQDLGVPMQCDTAGHEGAGVLVAKGEDVGDEWKLGDRCGLKPIYDVCHECYYCRNGNETYCDKVIYTGSAANGSYSQYVTMPARYTTRIPDGVNDDIAGPIQCSGGTAWSAIKKSGVKFGQYLLVVGAGGGVGTMTVQYAKAMGARVVGLDGGDEKRDMCIKSGAESYVDFTKSKDLEADVLKATNGGAHAIIITGGVAAAYKGVVRYARKFGTIVAVGLPTAGTAFYGDDPLAIIFRGVTITSSLVSGMEDLDEAYEFATRGLIDPSVKVYPFNEFPQRVKDLVASKVAGRSVIDFNT